MACTPAPLARQILAEAAAIAPGRNRATDGICPSAEHTAANPTSYHERGMAVDTTDDPRGGFDADDHAEAVRLRCQNGQERRVDQIISDRRIATPRQNWAWRDYNGTNSHESHVHYSLNTREAGAPFLVGPSAWAGVAEFLKRLFSFLGALTPTVGPEVLDVQIVKRKGPRGDTWMLGMDATGPIRRRVPNDQITTVVNGYKSCGGKVGVIDSQGLALYRDVTDEAAALLARTP